MSKMTQNGFLVDMYIFDFDMYLCVTVLYSSQFMIGELGLEVLECPKAHFG